MVLFAVVDDVCGLAAGAGSVGEVAEGPAGFWVRQCSRLLASAAGTRLLTLCLLGGETSATWPSPVKALDQFP